METAAVHEMGEMYTCLCRQEFLSRHWTGLPIHQPVQPLRYYRWLDHRDNQEPLIPGLFDFVLCTKLGHLPRSHWQYVSLILSPPTRSHWLNQLPNSPGRFNSARSGISERDVIRHVRWELDWLRSECSGTVYSQASPAWRPTTTDTGWYSEWKPEKPAVEEDAEHQRPRSQNHGQPPAEIGDPPSQRLEKR